MAKCNVLYFESFQTYTIKTPLGAHNQFLKGIMKPPADEALQKKRKVFLDLDTHSDSSEQSDLLVKLFYYTNNYIEQFVYSNFF